MKRLNNVSLKAHHTFHIDATASQWIEYKSEEELLRLLPTLREKPWMHLGSGSNVLFTTPVVDTLLLHSAIDEVETVEKGSDYILVRLGAGVTWDSVCWDAAVLDLYGCENLSLIPGEVGAAAVQNIGAYGVEFKDIVESVETIDLDGNRHRFSVNELNYGYRDSAFKHELKGKHIITYVTIRLSITPKTNLTYAPLKEKLKGAKHPTSMEIREAVVAIRQSKLPDPDEMGSAGSYFKNPVVEKAVADKIKAADATAPYFPQPDGRVKLSAAWLIDHSGLKGKGVGGARVHDKQPLVLVNFNGKATAADVLALAELVQNTVEQRYGVRLEPEVIYV